MKRCASLLAIAAACLPLAAQQQPARPKITGIDHVRVYVSDLHTSRAFYSKLIGVRSNGGACEDTSGSCFTVGWERNQRIELEKAPASGTNSWLAEISFNTDDVERMRDYLVAHGIRASKIIGHKYDKQTLEAYFECRDPEGHRISFIQHFAIPVDDPGPNDPSFVKILHAGFVVKDMAAENRFYRDLLGFRLYWYGGFKDVDRSAVASEKDTDWYEIQVPDGPDWIEYMLNIPANADHKELGVQNHFSLGVKDAQTAAAQLRKNGLQTFDGPEIGRDGKNSLDAYDPDGTRVEIMDFLPSQKPCCHPYTAEHPRP
jgi:catechol 2,3-dioxygenase-like lactoylglutathione lyase family enzyme